MGSGSSTSQNNVVKRPTNFSSDEGVVGAGGGGFDKDSAKSCLISFKAKIKMVTRHISVDDKFSLVGGTGASLQLIGSSGPIGSYEGSHVALLRQCIAGGYIYIGQIDNIESDGATAQCTVTGMGPAA